MSDEATFFETPEAFRDWLESNHDSADSVWVGYWKVGTGRPSMTWAQSVDEALCFGWIDGIRKSVDANSYKIRFTPRRPSSIWSAVNIERVETLMRLGRMHVAGVRAFEARTEERSRVYSFERDAATLPDEYLARLTSNSDAWEFWERQPAGYRKLATHWVLDAKRDETRERRLATLIADSAAGRRIRAVTLQPRGAAESEVRAAD